MKVTPAGSESLSDDMAIHEAQIEEFSAKSRDAWQRKKMHDAARQVFFYTLSLLCDS